MHVHVHGHVHRHVDGHGGGRGTVVARTGDRRRQILHVVLRVVMSGGTGAGGVITGGGTAGMDHRVLQGQENVGDAFAVRAVARSGHAFAARAAPAVEETLNFQRVVSIRVVAFARK